VISKETFSGVGTLCLNLAEESNRVARIQQILANLRFKSVKFRHGDIKYAHPETFKWIFSNVASSKPERPRSPFCQWMESGSGIFWIAGKAGSGKSTLVKYVYGHQRTRDLLQIWAGEFRLVVASYFFWSAGTKMQKSQEGLLQTLLYEVLRQLPEIVPTVCPAQWNQTSSPCVLEPWTMEELSEAFVKLAKHGPLTSRFCFIVDGLDEYDGEHSELILLLRGFASSPSIKLCVSSRPWNVFREAFGEDPEQKLLLQDFTREDIRLYIRDLLEKDPRFLKLTKKEDGYHVLVEEIVDKAQGVFLWVYLVVRSLLRGLTDGNDIATFQLRLRQLPPSLKQYFKQIFDTVEEVYRPQTGQIFQMLMVTLVPLSTVVFHFLEKEKVNANFALLAPIKALEDSEVEATSEGVRQYLNARCKDLVEINTSDQAGIPLLRYRVEFLHRTVRDFLATKDMHNILESMIPAGFNARVSLCRVLLAQLKSIPPVNERSMISDGFVGDIMSYARDIEVSEERAEVSLLDEVDRVQSIFSKSKLQNLLRDTKELKTSEKFMTLATQAGLHLYVAQKLSGKPAFLSRPKQEPLLSVALQGMPVLLPQTSGERQEPGAYHTDLNMIRIVLEGGADPNIKLFQTSPGTTSRFTIWETFLRHCVEHRSEYSRTHPKELYEITSLLIRNGADPDLSCETHITERRVRRSTKGGSRSTIVLDTHYSTPNKILKEVLTPTEHNIIVELLAESRASIAKAKRDSRPRIWKWIRQ
jgi:hypothetical protein